MYKPVVTQSPLPAPFEAFYADTVFRAFEPLGGWPSVFAVITAFNPVREEGAPVKTEEENEERAALLKARLTQDGYTTTFLVTGASPDLQHQEDGEGVATEDLGYVAQLAEEFGQWGFFWVQRGTVYICIDGSGTGWPIGIWSEKVQTPQTFPIKKWGRILADCGINSHPLLPGELLGANTVMYVFPPNKKTNDDSVSS